MSESAAEVGTTRHRIVIGSFCGIAALWPAAAPAGWESVDAGRGAVSVRVPDAPAPPEGRPLIVLLHGYGASGFFQELYLQLSGLAAERGFLYATPDGTLNPEGKRFWNATDACCDFYGSGVDDVGYLTGLIDAIDARFGVDPRRVHLFGHSNGGFMAYRMACSAAGRLTSAVSLAGATYFDPADCSPSRPVRILQIHGSDDETILYGGGILVATPYPGAEQDALTWAAYDGCLDQATTGAPFDAEATIAGDETEVASWSVGCRGPGAGLWTIVGGAHVPSFTATFRQRILDWFEAAGAALFADAFESGDLRAWAPPEP